MTSMSSTCSTYSTMYQELWRSRDAVENTRCQNRWSHSSLGKTHTHYWDLWATQHVLDNDVDRAHLNWAVWGEQGLVRWKGTEISDQRDHLKCERHGPPQEQGSCHCDYCTGRGRQGRERSREEAVGSHWGYCTPAGYLLAMPTTSCHS